MFYNNQISLHPNFINNNNNMINMKFPINIYNIQPEIYLTSSILLETLSTCCLKRTQINKIWFIPVYIGYGVSFYIFPKSLCKFSLTTAYTIWCGSGIILTTIFDKFIYKEAITIKKIIGSLIIIYGIYFSK